MKWQYFPSVGIKAPLHQWDMSHYGLVLDLAKMYNGRSTTATLQVTATATATTITTAKKMLLLLVVLCINQATSMSLDRLAIERNELLAPLPDSSSPESSQAAPASAAPAAAADVVVDDMKMTAVPAQGQTDMYMLVPETLATQLDDIEHVHRNTIETDADAEQTEPEHTDMLMLESEDAPAMQLMELPSELIEPETQTEALAAEPEPMAAAEAESEAAAAAIASPELIEEHVVEQPAAVSLEQSAEQMQAQTTSQEAQLENADGVVEPATEAAQIVVATQEQEQELQAADDVDVDVEQSTAAAPAATDAAATVIEKEETPIEVQSDADSQTETETETEVQAQPEKAAEMAAVLPVEDPEEVSKSEALAQDEVQPIAETTETTVLESMAEGIEEGLTAAMSELLPEEAAEPQQQQNETPQADELALSEQETSVQQEDAVTEVVEQPSEIAAPEIAVAPIATEQLPQADEVQADEVQADELQQADAVPEQTETAQETEQTMSQEEQIAPAPALPSAESIEKETASDAAPQISELAEEPVQQLESQAATSAEQTHEMQPAEPIAEQPQEAEKLPAVFADEMPVDATEPTPAKPTEASSLLTTIIPIIVPQSEPVQVMDSVLNYVNASFMQQPGQAQEQDLSEMMTPESSFNAHLRRYDGAQVWRIVVQTDKDKKLADELQSKYDGQLWKEVKQEVDYLLKPQVLAAAERHIRAANLSRIVLIDNLQQVIEVENPPAEQIAELQNRKGHRLTWQAYHRLEDIHGFIDYMAKTYPDICSTEIIGYSVEKRPLKILKISNGNAHNPGIWIDGGMHAREWISPATVTYIANQIAEGWEDQPEHMRNINWYIHPVANPDGYEYSHTTDRLWRKNMRAHGRQCPGVDLNRNFGYKWGGKGTSASPCSQTYRGSKAFSEPETFYISKFISGFPRETFQGYLSFHSYGQYILYPWGYDYHLTKDRADLDRVARQAGTIITKSSGVKYTVGSSATTLYPAAGGSDDWAKGIAGIKYAYTVEMGDTGRYGFVLPAQFIQSNAKDGLTFTDTVARAVTQGRGGNIARSNSNRRHHR